jgi:hypothetical protein
MEELVGHCESCKRPVFCLNGFLDGVNEQGILLCFPCADGEKVINQKK